MAGGNLINGRSAERQLLYFLAPQNFGSGMRRGGQQEIGRQDGIRPSRLSSDSTRSSLQEEDKDAGHTYCSMRREENHHKKTPFFQFPKTRMTTAASNNPRRPPTTYFREATLPRRC